MPKVLERMCLQMDPLMDAAGSPFDKADRLYLYLHVQELRLVLLHALCFYITISNSHSTYRSCVLHPPQQSRWTSQNQNPCAQGIDYHFLLSTYMKKVIYTYDIAPPFIQLCT